jgi:hypothetical protein
LAQGTQQAGALLSLFVLAILFAWLLLSARPTEYFLFW